MSRNRTSYTAASAVGLLIGLTNPVSAEVTFEWATVGNTGNAADPLNEGVIPGVGSVAHEYRIAKHEVTNDQYAAFLNAVGTTDTNGLYHTNMGSDPRGGINQSGFAPNLSYAVKLNMGNKPVDYVSFFDAMRFVNWLHNRQPTGAQDASTTEDGVYTIGGGLSEARAADARFFIPTDNEWYKAAYHQPSSDGGDADGYWLYPTASNGIPTVATATGTGDIGNTGPNVVNYDSGADWNGQDGNVTTVGSAGSGSESYFGTFDQGGNLWEWNEAVIDNPGFGPFARGLRGGSWGLFEGVLRSSFQGGLDPSFEGIDVGFRVASPLSTRFADLDGDGDVDIFDFALMQAAFTGPMRPHPVCGNGVRESGDTFDARNTAPGGSPDLDLDGDVDIFDFALMHAAFTGPGGGGGRDHQVSP